MREIARMFAEVRLANRSVLSLPIRSTCRLTCGAERASMSKRPLPSSVKSARVKNRPAASDAWEAWELLI